MFRMTLEAHRAQFPAICSWLKKSIPNSLYVYNALAAVTHESVQTSNNLQCFVNCLENPTMAITLCQRKFESESGYNFIEMLIYFDDGCDSKSKLEFIQSPMLGSAINLHNAPIELWYLSNDHEIIRDGLTKTIGNFEIQQFGGEDLEYVLTYLSCKPSEIPFLQPEFKLDSLLPDDIPDMCQYYWIPKEKFIGRDELFRNRVATMPSSCVRNADGRLISFAHTTGFGLITFAYTVEQYRGKGLFGVVCTDLAKKLHDIGLIPFASLACDNEPSFRAFIGKLKWMRSENLWKHAMLNFKQ